MPLYEPDVKTQKATFALSWFWFPEAEYGCASGVIRTRVGYTGGTTKFPTYTNLGDHTETIDIDYDPEVTNYEELLKLFWSSHDSTACQKRQYMSAIFYHDNEQKELAEMTKRAHQNKEKKQITTQILPAQTFYNAEDYHQKYLLQSYNGRLLQSMNIDDGEELINSHVAARVNGYVGRYGTMENFEKEWNKLGLSDDQANYVRREIAKGPRSH